jgi:hypothetical protein
MAEIEKGFSWAIYFDAVHILSVNYARREVRLYENAGSGDGKLLVTKDDPADKVSINDAMALFKMGLLYGVSYDLLAQCATEEARGMLEKLGTKEFLDRMLSLTTDEERRMRFQGFNFSFSNENGKGKEATETPPAATGKKVAK